MLNKFNCCKAQQLSCQEPGLVSALLQMTHMGTVKPTMQLESRVLTSGAYSLGS